MESPAEVNETPGRASPTERDAPAPGGGREESILAAREDERARLAAELHDGTAQALSNMVMQAEIVERALRRDQAAAEEEVRALKAAMQRELDRLRAYISGLRPLLPEPEALETALHESASDLTARTGIRVDVSLAAASTDLTDAERGVAVRVAEEALRNVAKHASAEHAWVSTGYADADGHKGRLWVLEIGDDGRGFDVSETTRRPSRHFGLRFMRERAALVGADLAIEAAPSTGTVVRLLIKRGGEEA